MKAILLLAAVHALIMYQSGKKKTTLNKHIVVTPLPSPAPEIQLNSLVMHNAALYSAAYFKTKAVRHN